MKKEILRMDNIITNDPSKTNLNHFSINLFEGEILGLIAINERGLDKFLELLIQNTAIKFGKIYLKEILVNSYKFSNLSFNRVYILSGQNKLIDHLNVLDNIFILRRGFKKYIINSGVLSLQFKRLLQKLDLNIDIDPHRLVGELTEYQRHIIEIIKAVVQGIKVIVINNISNDLSEHDLAAFKKLLKRLVSDGYGIIYIGNHHEEVFPTSNRVALMKDGSIIKIFEKEELFDKNILPYTISMDHHKTMIKNKFQNETILFQDIRTDYLKNLSFRAQRGTCTVLYDKSNKVQKDIIDFFTGIKQLPSGSLWTETNGIRTEIKKKEWRYQIGIIDEIPIQKNIYPHLSFVDNLCSALDNKQKSIYISKKLKSGIQKEYHKELGDAVYETDLNKLDKKDLYNLAYYKIILQNPKIVFIAQPFTDADMYLRFHILKLIRLLEQKGITVIIPTFSISDNLHIADQFILIENGCVKKEFLPQDFSDIILDI